MTQGGRAARSLAVALALLACSSSGPVEIKVTRQGFDPPLVRAVRGKPIELVVTRTTDETCATEIVIPEAGISAPLPLGKAVKVSFTPLRSGRLKFMCAMGMFGGTIEVQ